MDKQRDQIKIADRATVHYEKQDGTYQQPLIQVRVDYICEKPTFIVGLHNGREWRVPWDRVVHIESDAPSV
jgi:hypothetical protein